MTVLGNANTGTLTTDGTNYKFGGGITIGPDYTMVSSPLANSFTTTGNVSFLGNVTVDGTLTVDSGGGNISVAGNISSTGTDEVISITDGASSSGTITLGGTVSASSITLIGDNGIELTGNITSNTAGAAANNAAGAITFTGPVSLAGNVTIDADQHNATTVTFNSAVDSKVASTGASNDPGKSLTIDTDSGAIQMQGGIGASKALTALTINSDGDATIEVANIGSASVGVTGATAIGNTDTGTLTLDGTTYKTTGSQTYTNMSAASGGGDIVISGTTPTFTTDGTAIEFNTADVILSNNGTTTITTGSGAGGVTFGGAIETNGGDNDILTITSGTGNVTFTGALGVTNELGGLNVNSSTGDGDITFTGNIGASSTKAGVIGTTLIGNTTTDDLNFNSTIYSFDGGDTTIKATSGDSIDLAADAPTAFYTIEDNIEFANGNIHLSSGTNLTVDTGAAGGDITINEIAGTLRETVTLDAGSGTTSVGVIGDGTEIGALTIGSAQNGGITLNGAITTDGVVTIDGPVTLATGAVSVTTADDNITFEGTINGGQSLTLSSGAGAIDLQGDIGTANSGTIASLTINNTNGASGTISLPNIGTVSAKGVSGATAVGNTSTGTLTLAELSITQLVLKVILLQLVETIL